MDVVGEASNTDKLPVVAIAYALGKEATEEVIKILNIQNKIDPLTRKLL